MKLLVRNERSFPHACLFFLLNLFMYLFILAKSGLHCCAQAFFSCDERRLLLLAVCRLLIVVASLVSEHRLSVHGLQELLCSGLVVATVWLSNCGSQALELGLNSCGT